MEDNGKDGEGAQAVDVGAIAVVGSEDGGFGRSGLGGGGRHGLSRAVGVETNGGGGRSQRGMGKSAVRR